MKHIPILSILFFAFITVFACGNPDLMISLEGKLLQQYQDAKVQYYNGALSQAAAGFKAVVDAAPNFFQGKFMWGKTLFAQGKTAEAEALFRDLTERYPMYHDARIWLIRSELANKKIEAAETDLKELLAFDANDPRLLTLYARVSQLKEDPTTALQYYQLSTQYEEELAFNRYEIARYYYQFGLKEKALLEIDKCLLLLPMDHASRGAIVGLKKTITESMETPQ